MRAGALSNRTIRLFAYLRRPVKPRVREGVGPGRTMAVRAGSRYVSGQGRDCRTVGRYHAVTRIRERAGGGAALWRPDRRFEPASGKGGAGAFNDGAGWVKMCIRAGAGLPYSRKAPRGCPYPGRGRGRGGLVEAGSPFRARVREGAGPGRSMTVRARSRCVSGQGQDCRTAGRHHTVARIRERAGGGATLWKPDRRFEPVSGEGRGRGVQWRRGLGQDACQGRHSLLSENYISTV